MKIRAGVQHDDIAPDTRVTRFSITERLSRLFDARVELAHPDPDLDLAALLDKPCLLSLEDEDSGDVFRFHGMVDEAEALEPIGLEARYALRLRPRLAALAHRVRTRLFQAQDAVEIVKAVLKDAGIPDEAVSFQVQRRYQKRDLCIQFGESELDFVLRLLEDEGIFFWFDHSGGEHVLVLGDAPGVHSAIEGTRELRFTRWLHGERELVSDLVFSSTVGPDVHVTRDWNWQRPSDVLEAEKGRDDSKGRVWYEYPGGFAETNDGAHRAQDRLDAVDRTRVLTGRSNCLRLAPGRLFDVVGASPAYLDRDWLLVQVTHDFDETPAATASAAEGGHTARFEAIPGDAPFHPERRTPRPRIRGTELAVITGPGGEDIHVDEMARVKVHFVWDREGATDDTSSAWIRTQQINTSGAMILPRIGWEVHVGFIDGDPDRPVALQKLYNRDTMPPHALPDAKTKSSLQSHTTAGGEGVNALALEDGSGGMELGLVASKDLSIVVGHDATEKVGTDASEEVGMDLQTLVGGDEEVSVASGQSTSVGGGSALETVGDKSVTIGGMDSLGVKGLQSFTCDGSRTETIGALANVMAAHVVETVNGSSTRTIGGALCLNAVKALVEVVGGSKTESVGAARVEVLGGDLAETIAGSKVQTSAAVLQKAGGDVSHAAGGAMALNVGGILAVKAGGGVTVSGAIVNIVTASAALKAGGSSVKADGSLKVDAPSMAISGGAVVILKGSINYKG